jgi:phage terminase small subunit
MDIKKDEIVNLAPKKEKFCQLFVKYDRNGTKAAKEAYANQNDKSASVTACRLLKDDRVKARICQLEAPIIAELQINAKWVLNRSIEIVERCMQHEPVMVRGIDGPEQAIDPETGQGVFQFDAKGANQALSLIAKHTGGFVDRQDHTTMGEKIIQNTYNIIDKNQKEIIDKLQKKADEV